MDKLAIQKKLEEIGKAWKEREDHIQAQYHTERGAYIGQKNLLEDMLKDLGKKEKEVVQKENSEEEVVTTEVDNEQ